MGLTYVGAGVKYGKMDPFKQLAIQLARATSFNLDRLGFREVPESRGESAYLVETPDNYLAHVQEGLGTKILVADAMYRLTDKSYYHYIAQDTVAMIVNDMATTGAMPVSVAMHLAAGSSDWFGDEKRCLDLLLGWQSACRLAGCAWAGGETSTLKDIVMPGAVELSGSAIGIIQLRGKRIMGDIQDGDAIVFIGSSGIHANGLTLARSIADRVENGYQAELSDGRTFGDALLDPTVIYVPLIRKCLVAGATLHYIVNITGHGLRKLMRLPVPAEYVVEHIPKPQPVFQFIQEYVDNREAYGNLNMGAGYAIYVPQGLQADGVIRCANQLGMTALKAGHICMGETVKKRKVIIQPLDLEYSADELEIR